MAVKNKIKYAVFGSRIVVAAVFIGAGVIKLIEPVEEFIAIAREWNIIGEPFLTWYITLLPWVEVIFGIMLLVGLYKKISSSVIGLSLISFIIGIVTNMARGKTLEECGCFGSAFEFGDTFGQLLWRDLILLAMVVLIFLSKSDWLSLDGYFKKKKKA